MFVAPGVAAMCSGGAGGVAGAVAVPALHVSAPEHEGGDIRGQERSALKGVRSNPGVFGEHDPAASTDGLEPVYIAGIGFKLIVVRHYGLTDLAEGAGDESATEGSIDEEGEGFS